MDSDETPIRFDQHNQEQRETIRLSARDTQLILEALLHPQPPHPRLRRAAEQYKTMVSDQG